MSEEDIRKSCLSSGHQQQGGRLGEVCVPCMEYDNRLLRTANASLLAELEEKTKRLTINRQIVAEKEASLAALQARLALQAEVVEAAKECVRQHGLCGWDCAWCDLSAALAKLGGACEKK